jgi:PIN domain nuclease of toxin-antitoxin system
LADDGLTADARSLVAEVDVAAVSAASVWEAGTKARLGKLRLDGPLAPLLEPSGFVPLAVTPEHADLAASLPLIHRDPFDRMLVAQARIEGLTIVTRDAAIMAYDVPTILV